jgi:hypothetical protein
MANINLLKIELIIVFIHTMEQILKHVAPQNKEWVESLTPEQMGALLNTLSLVPNMATKVIKEDNYSDKSAVRGLQGEDMFESMLSEFMPSDYTCENVAKSGKMGDFILTHKSHKTNKKYKLLVDIKNYRSTVPSKELDKFYRDLNINHVHGGFMISLHSKIVGQSKTIVFETYNADRGAIPTLLAQTNTPLAIVELIKLMFHIIEIKDISYNNITRKGELISNINQLNDHIGLITSCRDILTTTRGVMEKSLDEIMMKLMTCEYTFIAKINQINNGLMETDLHEQINTDSIVNTNIIDQQCTSTSRTKEVLKTELKNNFADDPIDKIKTLKVTPKPNPVNEIAIKFGGSFNLGDEHFLRSIYDTHTWNSINIIACKKEWHLSDDANYVIIKFAKKSIKVIFPNLNDAHTNIITLHASKGKSVSAGYAMILNQTNIVVILELLNVIV